MGRGVEWDKSRIEKLTTLYRDPDKTVEEIAIELGCTENALRLKASRLGISRPIMDYDCRELITELKRLIPNKTICIQLDTENKELMEIIGRYIEVQELLYRA